MVRLLGLRLFAVSSADVQQHIEQWHMFLLSNGSGAGSNFPSFRQNSVNLPASQYMFEPDGTPNANWQLGTADQCQDVLASLATAIAR